MRFFKTFHFPWEPPKKPPDSRRRWRRYILVHRSGWMNQLRPQRWNWYGIIRPLDRSLTRTAQQTLTPGLLLGLRYFWLDGLFSAISENFFLTFMPLYALAYGASNGQVGWLTAIANLLGALALFPGARAVDRVGRRKPIVIWTGGGLGRLMLLLLALLPLFTTNPGLGIWSIVILNGLRALLGNFGNPAWTALVADLVPGFMRGRYFSSRNIAMGIAALVVVPGAGWLIKTGNAWPGHSLLGYQAAFLLAFIFGMLSTYFFQQIPEPPPSAGSNARHQRGDLRRALKKHPEFAGLIASAFIWNLAIQVSAPFFNVYLVTSLNGTVFIVGLLAAVSSLFDLGGQHIFGRLVDRKGTLWVQMLAGLLIPVLPLAWAVVTAPWQVAFINAFGGLIWAGYNLSNFNLLLEMTPDEQRPRAVALYQTAVFGSAVIGPLAGGYLADAAGFRLVFVLSAVGRVLAMAVFFWLTVRPAWRKPVLKEP